MMGRTLGAVLALAGSQRREVTRQPVYGVVLLAGVALIALSPALAMFALGRADPLVLDLGASTTLFFGAFLAATAVAASAAERLQDGTATLVLTRPVGPLAWLVGGFLGAVAALLQSGIVLGATLLLAAKNGPEHVHPGVVGPGLAAVALALGWGLVRSLAGRPFQPAALDAGTLLLPLAFGAAAVLESDEARRGLDAIAAAAAFLATLAAIAFAGLGTCLATRLPPAGAAALTLVGFVLGSLVGATTIPGTGLLALVIPDVQLYWVGDAAYTDVLVPVDYLLGAVAYTALYCAGALGIGAWLLGGRELG